MRGVILEFDKDSGKGLISGDDKERYTFTAKDWKSEDNPKTQMKVDFEVSDKNKAIVIYMLKQSEESIHKPNMAHNKVLNLFVGYFLLIHIPASLFYGYSYITMIIIWYIIVLSLWAIGHAISNKEQP